MRPVCSSLLSLPDHAEIVWRRTLYYVLPVRLRTLRYQDAQIFGFKGNERVKSISRRELTIQSGRTIDPLLLLLIIRRIVELYNMDEE